ncbi:MAG: peroxide stress protein YaaA [Burkholderiaceae bacterium]|nr:peroxide stress protein YaaA [Burkholderiaceae bacterium]
MLFLLSPAKTLDYETAVPPELLAQATTPQFVTQSAELIALLKTKSPADIAELMDLSNDLSTLNVHRYAAWSKRFTKFNSKPAVLAFAGDVYDGLDANSLSTDDIAWAQQHVAILSGLYGVLRPLDKLQPYRLEMGTRLANAHGSNLYAFWGDTLAQYLDAQLARDKKSALIVNLASQEYFKAADRKALRTPVIECVFEDWKNGQFKVISFFAKRARGLMARYAIQNRLKTAKALEGFNLDGYGFDAAASEPQRLVFRRRLA